jgi:dipeptidyl aminopeptidase/acylaminoacyl peptidase
LKKLSDYKVMPIFAVPPVSDPQVSPDGDRILFTYTTVNMRENRYDSHVWILELEGGEPRQFTHGRCNDSGARWSPDGRSIIFLSNRSSEDDENQKNQVWVIPSDGGEAHRLTSMEENAQHPSWSPDGKSILFYSNVFKGEKEEGSDVRIIRKIDYKRDGRGIFGGERTHIFSVPSSGGKVRKLTDGEHDVVTAAWSADGKRIAFVSQLEESGDVLRDLYFKDIYIIPSKGGEPELLLKSSSADIGRIDAIGWSPNGRYIAFTGRVAGDLSEDIYKDPRVWVCPAEGGEPRCLTADLDRPVRGEGMLLGALLRWSPDSKYIYFRISDQGSTHLCRVSLDGKVERITEGKLIVGSFSIDGAGSKIVYEASDMVTTSEIMVKDEAGTRRLTEMNRGLMKELRVSEPEEFWFTTSEGIKIHGWIVKPHDFVKGKKYPMILEVHGGPHGMFGYQLSGMEHEFQVLADHGYVVVYTNPRASTGYGEALAAPVYGLWGELDSKDLLEALDYVTKKYHYIDPDRMGVTGLSYGGYMTNWLVGHTDRFKAAVSRNSLTNMYSGWGTSDIGWMGYQICRSKTPWDNLQFYMEQSPIHYIKDIKTPLLLIHCEDDIRCPIEQSEQLFTGLMKLGRVVEFVRFPGESHVMINIGKPKHRVERLQHILRWFDTYLKQA